MLPPAGEGRSNSDIPLINKVTEKAAIVVCLFLLIIGSARAQEFAFDQNQLEAYRLALNLQPVEALQKISDESLVEAAYVASLAEAIELLITEDNSKFTEYEDRFQRRVDKNLKGSPRDYQFLQAEIRLQWAFVYLKFGHELDAAMNLRQAYQIAVACKEKYPDYMPIRKTTGLLQVIVGTVPDKYDWVLSLLNMNGSVSGGLADLNAIAMSDNVFAHESKILFALVEGFILSRPESALDHMQEILATEKDNRLLMFFTASIAIKDSKNDVALEMLEGLATVKKGVPIHYAEYLRGEAYLHKSEYLNAISSYRWFISNQNGQNYIKDAYYKIGLCYLLHGNQNDALSFFKEARKKGKESTEADRSAAHSLSAKELPNVQLLKARHLTDGGYYREAEKILAGLNPANLAVKKDRAEYAYRKARLAHKMNRAEAIEYYRETINLTGQENWYFAPNACLQLGYLYQAQQKVKEAEEFFMRALAYRHHEYKNSIDSKARSALTQLGRI